MSNDTLLPFDALRPFKSKPEEFTPRDNLPWESQAEPALRYRTGQGFLGLRPLAQIEADVAWLAEQLPLSPGAAILDIGCGPGLYSNRLAARGYQVTGIDIAQPFLDYAQTEAETQGVAGRCTYQRLSMFELTYLAEFDTILLINSIAKCLTPAELESMLAKIQTALKPGGQLIAEFATQLPDMKATEASVTESLSFLPHSPWSEQFHAWLQRDLIFPATGERVNHHLLLTADGQLAEYWSRFKLHTVTDLTQLLITCGFRVQALFGPTLGQPYQIPAEICFIWAQRAD